MKHSLFVGLIIAIIAGIFVMSSSSAGVDDKDKLADEFANKIAVIYLAVDEDTEAGGGVIENIEFKKIGGHLMIIGTGVDTGQDANWLAGTRFGLRWDLVACYSLMTPEQFKAKKEYLELK